MKFTEHGAITVDLTLAGDTVTVTITDTGPGVPLADQQQIFDEFRSSARTAARGYGGLGLGLAICKQLIDRHGGTIGLSSSGAEDGGATFFFTLPLIGAPAPPAARGRGRQTAGASSWQPTTRRAGTGWRWPSRRGGLTCRSSRWAARRTGCPAWSLRPPAVILDAALATGRGWEILAVLKRHPATAHLPVLMVRAQPR